MKLEQKRVILTGASGGIGRCLTEKLAMHDCRLLLVDRDMTKLEEMRDKLHLDHGCCHLLAVDITSSDGRQHIVTAAQEMLGSVDILINLRFFAPEQTRAKRFLTKGREITPKEVLKWLPVCRPGNNLQYCSSCQTGMLFSERRYADNLPTSFTVTRYLG